MPSAPIRLGMEPGGETGAPSVSTMWQPTPSAGCVRATSTASSKAAPLAISVVDVITPAECNSPMARLMPWVRPKSSALRMRRAGMIYARLFGIEVVAYRNFFRLQPASCAALRAAATEVSISAMPAG